MSENKLPFWPERKIMAEILFANNKFRIPEFQRGYSWGEDQVEDFWNDLISDSDSNFIGSFVLNYENLKEEKKDSPHYGYIDIIDGQQRVITISLFLSVIRNIAKAEGFIDLADRIQRNTLGFEDPVNGQTTTRIVCGESLQDFYLTNVQKENSDICSVVTTEKEEKLVVDNALFFKSKIEEELKASPNKEEKLKEIYSNVREIISVQIRIDAEDDAFEIFETLNARGIDLTLGDLLKNLIFGKLKGKTDLETRWETVVSNLKYVKVDIAQFVRYFWISKYSFLPGKKIYREIKRELKTVSDYDKFLNELVNTSNHFKLFLNSNLDDWTEYDHSKEIYDSMSGIKTMEITQCYVLFTALMRNDFTKTRWTKFFKLVEQFSFIYFFISKQPANKVERLYSKIAIEIESHSKEPESRQLNLLDTSFRNLKDQLIKIKPERSLFLEKFESIEYKNSPTTIDTIRYILTQLNNSKTTGEHSIDFTNVNIEHVLPKNPAKWDLTKTAIKPYVNKLGNLTLLHHKINSEIGNDIISVKLPELEKSEIQITKEFVIKLKALNKWKEEDILSRHKELSEESYDKVWKYW